MSGGRGLRAPGCFPPPAAATGGRRSGGLPRGKAAARAFPGGSRREALGRQVFVWIAALD